MSGGPIMSPAWHQVLQNAPHTQTASGQPIKIIKIPQASYPIKVISTLQFDTR